MDLTWNALEKLLSEMWKGQMLITMDTILPLQLHNQVIRHNKLKQIIAAMQFLGGNGVVEKRKILNQSAVKIVLGLEEDSAGKVAKEIDSENSKNLKDLITKFDRGEAIVYGQLENSDGTLSKKKYVKITTVCRNSNICPPK